MSGKLIFLFMLVFLLAQSVYVFASPEEKPDWLKRVELSVQCETDQKPMFYFQMVQPLYQDEQSTVFYQPRVSLKDGTFTYNLGLGYRWLLGEDLLLGINLFGDYQDRYEHGRAGLGFEAIGQVWELRTNGYFGITSKRVVEESATTTVYERVADGWDFEIGAPVPYLPWLKVYGSGFWYDFENFSDRKGWRLRVEAKLSDAVLWEFYTWDDNKGEQEYGTRLRCRLTFDKPSDLVKGLKISRHPFEHRDLRCEMLKPVERNYEIVVEKWSESASVTIEVGRGI